MKYLENVWYMAAWSHELGANQILRRTLLDTPVALFRRNDRSPAALLDRCPHRFAPLSAGHVRGDGIVCGYHGLGFDGMGHCILNPHGQILRSMAIPAYRVQETHRGIWIWMGEADRADPGLIPDLSYLDDVPETAFSCGYIVAKGNYQVFVDNLMDLSHVDYLHPTTLGGGATTSVKPKIEVHDDRIEVTWSAPGAPPPPLLVRLLGESTAKTDLLTRVFWFPASVVRLTASTIPAGASEIDWITNDNAHILTPETSTTSHYFFAAARNFRVDDQALNETIAEEREAIFSTEDKPMIEKVQEQMGDADFWSLKPLLLPIDAGPVQVRRKLAALIAAEQDDKPS